MQTRPPQCIDCRAQGIDNDPGVHPALQPRRRRGRPRTKGLPDLQPGQVMTLDEALRVGHRPLSGVSVAGYMLAHSVSIDDASSVPHIRTAGFRLGSCSEACLRSCIFETLATHDAQVPPPPGVRAWNWRRQQTRAVMRQQALAEAAEGKGQGEQMPTTAAEALLLAAERQGSGTPVRICRPIANESHTRVMVAAERQGSGSPVRTVQFVAKNSHTRAML